MVKEVPERECTEQEDASREIYLDNNIVSAEGKNIEECIQSLSASEI